jgi:hypothetical protein
MADRMHVKCTRSIGEVETEMSDTQNRAKFKALIFSMELAGGDMQK